jgi:hypothetical protein
LCCVGSGFNVTAALTGGTDDWPRTLRYVLCSERLYSTPSTEMWLCWWSGRPAWPRTQHDYHHDTKVKPEAATAVIELLRMGGKTPETCWAVNKRQDNKLKNCCITLVIYLN